MTDDLLDQLRKADPAPPGRVARELRDVGDLPARIAAEPVVVPFRRRPSVRRAAVGIAAAIVALGLIVPLTLLRPLGDDETPGGTDPTIPGSEATWVAVGPLDTIRAEGVVYDAATTTFVIAPEGGDPYALYAIPLEDPREATRERVLFCRATEEFLGSRGDRYAMDGRYMAGDVDHGLSGVALRMLDGEVQIDPSSGLAPGDPVGIIGALVHEPDTDCVRAAGAPLEGDPGFAVPAGTELPPIAIALPQRGMIVSSPVRIVGSADVFEATVSIRIVDATNNVIAESFTTATCGTGCRGDFAADVAFEVGQEQQGTVQVFESSAKDGSMINVVEIPVTLRPGRGDPTAEAVEGEWTGPDGEPAPDGDPGEALVLNVMEGADHCGWSSVTFMHVGWPLGTDGSTGDWRQYVRDPQGLLTGRTSAPLKVNATLPADAVDTGFSRDAWSLWLAPSDQAAYVVNTGTGDVERWPRASTPILCA